MYFSRNFAGEASLKLKEERQAAKGKGQSGKRRSAISDQ
jgi:hypothetical protein